MTKHSPASWKRWISVILLVCFALAGLNSTSGIAAVHQTQPFQSGDGDLLIPLSDLANGTPLKLQGPFDSLQFDFELAPTKTVSADGSLVLELNVNLAALVLAGKTPLDLSKAEAGTVRIFLNDTELESIDIVGNKPIKTTVDLPKERLLAAGEINIIRLDLDSGQSCTNNLVISIDIADTSMISIPIDIKPVQWDVAEYPVMFYNALTLETPPLLVIVPDDAGAGELSAGANLISGLARLTQGGLPTRLLAYSELSEADKAAANLALIGNGQALASMSPEINSLLELPAKLPADSAFIQPVTSPWNQERTILVVKAETQLGFEKAVSALNLPRLESGATPGSAVISTLLLPDTTKEYQPDRKLSDLGMEEIEFLRPGGAHRTVYFDLPFGSVLNADAYLDLVMSHSDDLDYGNSSLLIDLNGTQIARLNLSDQTVKESTSRIILPVYAVKPGRNQLSFISELAPRDICADFAASGTNLRISADSQLHLPINYQFVQPVTKVGLDQFAQPFNSETLAKTQIVFPLREKSLWTAVGELAGALGLNSVGGSMFKVRDVAELPALVEAGGNLLVLATLPDERVTGALAPVLPLPLDAQGLPQRPEQLPEGTLIAAGDLPTYMELSQSNTAVLKTLLTVLGPEPEAISTAVKLLMTPERQSDLRSGNVALVKDDSVQAFNALVLETGLKPDIQPQAKPDWLLPAILIIAVILLGLALSTLGKRQKSI